MSLRVLMCYCCLLVATAFTVHGQVIKGEVLDMDTHQALTGVTIVNIHTGLGMESTTEGNFFINASGGQLLEFRKTGYKTARVRIPNGSVPTYFKIIMQQGIEVPLVDWLATLPPYKRDSIIYGRLYKHELDFAKMSTLDMIQHPFSAMSKRSREIWAFQDDYAKTQREKYVDFIFNEKLVTNITGLTGDSAQVYMVRYRPTYEELRSMNEYTFYTFIKRTAEQYRRLMTRETPRGAQ